MRVSRVVGRTKMRRRVATCAKEPLGIDNTVMDGLIFLKEFGFRRTDLGPTDLGQGTRITTASGNQRQQSTARQRVTTKLSCRAASMGPTIGHARGEEPNSVSFSSQAI